MIIKLDLILWKPNPRELFDKALDISFNSWVDEKNTIDNPGFIRRPSKLSYDEAYKLISNNKPHWVVSYRNMSYLCDMEDDYWEFGGCNIGNDYGYGYVYIWICLSVKDGDNLIKSFNLNIEEY